MISPTRPNTTIVAKVFQQAVTTVLSTSNQPVDVSYPKVTVMQISVPALIALGQSVVEYEAIIQYNVSIIADDAKTGVGSLLTIQQHLNNSVTSGNFIAIVQNIALHNFSSSIFQNVTLPKIQLSPPQTRVGHSGSLSSSTAQSSTNTSIIIPVAVVVGVLLICAGLYIFYQRKSREDILVIGEDLLDFGRDYQGTLADVIHSVDDSEVVRQSIDGLESSDVRASINSFASNQGGGSGRASFMSSMLSSVSQLTGSRFSTTTAPGAVSVARPSTSIRQPISRQPKSASRPAASKISLVDDAKPRASKPKNKKLEDCSVDHIRIVLDRLNLSKYVNMFIENNIDGRILCEITNAEDLQSCGISMPPPVMRAFLREVTEYQKRGIPDL